MQTRISNIILLLYLGINALFVDKYAARMTSYHTLCAMVYFFATGAGAVILQRITASLRHPRIWLLVVGGIGIVASMVVQYHIDPYSIQVDRWSAIHHFLDAMLEGDYPYGQQTHLGGYGSPLPVWQIVHLPFYALGNVGLSIAVVMVLFLLSIARIHGVRSALIGSLLIFASPACWYEIAVRSDLITNLMLVCVLCEWLVYYRKQLTQNTIGIGILCGLLLGTRLIAIIPLAVIYGYEFLKMDWKKQCTFLATVLGTFALIIAPFVFWEGSTLLFFEYNPFVLQTRQGSALAGIIFVIIALGITIYLGEDQRTRLAITGGLLTLLVCIAFIEKMWREDLWNGLYSSSFDITYFSIALPYYIVYLATHHVGLLHRHINGE